MRRNKKTWHRETAEAIKNKPNKIPKDIFFLFTKKQPYEPKKSNFDENLEDFRKIKKSGSLLTKSSRKKEDWKMETSEKYKSFDNRVIFSTVGQASSKMKLKKENILKEIGLLLQKYKKNEPGEFEAKEKDEFFEEYKNTSDKITLLTRKKQFIRRKKEFT